MSVRLRSSRPTDLDDRLVDLLAERHRAVRGGRPHPSGPDAERALRRARERARAAGLPTAVVDAVWGALAGGAPGGEPAGAPAPRSSRRPRATQPTGLDEGVAAAASVAAASCQVDAGFAEVVAAVAALEASLSTVAGSSGEAARAATGGVELARSVVERVARLQTASAQIGEIVQVITSITQQSRMLALNATIEATRAGDAGRGFAVVAHEVKQLAGKTAAAAESIAGQVAAVQDETAEAVSAIDDVRTTIEQIHGLQGGVVTEVDAQAEQVRRIVANVDSAARGSQQITESMGRLAEAQRASYLRTALSTALDVLADAGGLALDAERTTTWTVTDQVTGRARTASLPGVLLGGTPLARVDDPGVRVPVVDEVKRLIGGTTTLFQRAAPDGEMLRVATNVVTAAGRRAVGTSIPPRGADGRPNPVLAAVLAGETFFGEAVVVDRPYWTAYSPTLSEAGEVVGMLYVGLPREG